MRTGEYALAAEANAAAVETDRANVETCMHNIHDARCSPIYAGYYNAHNLLFLTVSYTMMRQQRRAIDTARQVDRIVPFFVAHGQPRLAHYLTTLTLTLERFHRWKDVLAVKPPVVPDIATAMTMYHYISLALHHWARSKAHIGLQSFSEARAEQALFKKYMSQITTKSGASYGSVLAASIVSVAALELEAVFEYSAATPNYVAAIELLQQAVTAQDAFPYDEPVAWMPVRVKLGAMYYLAGRPELALKAFNEDLYGVKRGVDGDSELPPQLDQRTTPKNVMSLYGVYQCMKALHRPSDEEKTTFDTAWLELGSDIEPPSDMSELVS